MEAFDDNDAKLLDTLLAQHDDPNFVVNSWQCGRKKHKLTVSPLRMALHKNNVELVTSLLETFCNPKPQPSRSQHLRTSAAIVARRFVVLRQ